MDFPPKIIKKKPMLLNYWQLLLGAEILEMKIREGINVLVNNANIQLI